VQIISLIAALQKKTGSKKDLKVIKERYQVIGEVSLFVSIIAIALCSFSLKKIKRFWTNKEQTRTLRFCRVERCIEMY